MQAQNSCARNSLLIVAGSWFSNSAQFSCACAQFLRKEFFTYSCRFVVLKFSAVLKSVITDVSTNIARIRTRKNTRLKTGRWFPCRSHSERIRMRKNFIRKFGSTGAYVGANFLFFFFFSCKTHVNILKKDLPVSTPQQQTWKSFCSFLWL